MIEDPIDELNRARAELAAVRRGAHFQGMKLQIDNLTAALTWAWDEMADMLPHIDEYFAVKWGYTKSIAAVRRLLDEGVWEEPK